MRATWTRVWQQTQSKGVLKIGLTSKPRQISFVRKGEEGGGMQNDHKGVAAAIAGSAALVATIVSATLETQRRAPAAISSASRSGEEKI